LARQAFLGNLWEKAIDFARQAGAKANAHSAYHEAAQLFEMGLAAADQLDDNAGSRRARAEINIDLSTTYPPLGEMNEGYQALERAESLYESLASASCSISISSIRACADPVASMTIGVTQNAPECARSCGSGWPGAYGASGRRRTDDRERRSEVAGG
jgi:hypothetical protein